MSALKKEQSCGNKCCENATELNHLCQSCLAEYHEMLCALYEPDMIRIAHEDHVDHEIELIMAEKRKFMKLK